MGDEKPPPVAELASAFLNHDATYSSLKHKFSDRITVKAIVGRADGSAGLAGQRVRVGGWVKKASRRSSSIFVEGVLKLPPPDVKQKVELSVEKVLHVGPTNPGTYPLPKTRLTLEHLREYLRLHPRTNRKGAINHRG